MKYWAGLYKSDFQEKLLDGVQILLACAHRVLARQVAPPLPRLMAADPDDQDDGEEGM
jgi:hypothetical protein